MTMLSKISPCFVESYIETVTIRDCLSTSMEIETTRCRGQCYSEDVLVYDWQAEPFFYRHQQQVHCCSPNATIRREIPIVCSNQQQRLIDYPVVTRCHCKFCTDQCDG